MRQIIYFVFAEKDIKGLIVESSIQKVQKKSQES